MSDIVKLKFKSKTVAEKLDLDHLVEVEEEFGFDFDPNFVEFLKLHNGGVPEKQYFRLEENVKVLERFLCLIPDNEESFFSDYDIEVVSAQIDDRLNDYLIPFASVFAGDFLCFDYENEDEAPSIVLWDHDLSEVGDPYIIHVADNFKDFLAMLSAKNDLN